MIIHNMLQGSEEWHAIRAGKLTGSNATAIGNNGKGLQTYVEDVVLALFIQKEFKSNKDTERGHRLEPTARTKYEFETGFSVLEVGFLEHNDYCGASPDGLVKGQKKGLEIKARNAPKHLALLRTQKVDSATIWQMNMNMLISGYETWDFVSYNKDFKQSFFLKTFPRDELKITKLRVGIAAGTKMLKEALSDPIIKEEIEWYNFKNKKQ
jgi:hypothetical protein